MPHAYHDNRARYFQHQAQVTREHVIPFIEESGPLSPGARVLEIGCAEAGVLQAFLERGAQAVGVDLNARRLERGREFLSEAISAGRLQLLHEDAQALLSHDQYRGYFDLIVLKDVIEHVDDRPNLFDVMAQLLAPGGRIFLAFPPWRMPFGGHQQMCESKVLSRLPYFHLLPVPAYRAVLQAFSERPSRRDNLLATKRTGLATAELERLAGGLGFTIMSRRFYLLNPMYTYRFGLKPLPQLRPITALSSWRDFVTTCAYYTLSPPAARRSERQAHGAQLP